jgi:hypothetical protein
MYKDLDAQLQFFHATPLFTDFPRPPPLASSLASKCSKSISARHYGELSGSKGIGQHAAVAKYNEVLPAQAIKASAIACNNADHNRPKEILNEYSET